MEAEEAGKGRSVVDIGVVLGLGVGAVLFWGSGTCGQVVERRSTLILLGVPTWRHPFIDPVQTSGLLKALDLVLWLKALNGSCLFCLYGGAL